MLKSAPPFRSQFCFQREQTCPSVPARRETLSCNWIFSSLGFLSCTLLGIPRIFSCEVLPSLLIYRCLRVIHYEVKDRGVGVSGLLCVCLGCPLPSLPSYIISVEEMVALNCSPNAMGGGGGGDFSTCALPRCVVIRFPMLTHTPYAQCFRCLTPDHDMNTCAVCLDSRPDFPAISGH